MSRRVFAEEKHAVAGFRDVQPATLAPRFFRGFRARDAPIDHALPQLRARAPRHGLRTSPVVHTEDADAFLFVAARNAARLGILRSVFFVVSVFGTVAFGIVARELEGVLRPAPGRVPPDRLEVLPLHVPEPPREGRRLVPVLESGPERRRVVPPHHRDFRLALGESKRGEVGNFLLLLSAVGAPPADAPALGVLRHRPVEI
mmetsp:Transcript_8375/g.34990  ORF Transcript_8375/g.34990 Transcript_8375/m.34990 type:complete len:202 (-) Transcript_8375:406-1011(-)